MTAGHSRDLGSGKDRRPEFPNPIPPQVLCLCLLLLTRSWMILPRTISIWVSDPAHSHSSSPRAGPSEGSPWTHRISRWPCPCMDSQALDSLVQHCSLKSIRFSDYPGPPPCLDPVPISVVLHSVGTRSWLRCELGDPASVSHL